MSEWVPDKHCQWSELGPIKMPGLSIHHLPKREKDQFFSKSQSPVEQFTGPNRTHLLEAENFLVLGNSIETSPGVHSEINIWGILCYWLAVIGSLINAPANDAWSHWWQTRKSRLEVFSNFSLSRPIFSRTSPSRPIFPTKTRFPPHILAADSGLKLGRATSDGESRKELRSSSNNK